MTQRLHAGLLAAAVSVAFAAPGNAVAKCGRDTPSDPEPGAPRLHLEVEGHRPVALHRVLRDFNRFRFPASVSRRECWAPCDRVIDGRAGDSFFIGGEAVTHSPRFHLVGATGDLTARVRPGRPAVYLAGWILALLGASTAALGIALTGASISRHRRDRTYVGIGMLAGGSVLLGVGLPLAIVGRTRVKWRRRGGHMRARTR